MFSKYHPSFPIYLVQFAYFRFSTPENMALLLQDLASRLVENDEAENYPFNELHSGSLRKQSIVLLPSPS